MINDNRKYDASDLTRRTNASGASIGVLQKLFVFLGGSAVIFGLVLLGVVIGRGGRTSGEESSSAYGVATIVGKIGTPTPTVPYTVPEYLSDSDTAVAMWGEFSPADQAVPYEHVPVHGIYTGAASYLDANLELAGNSRIDSFVIDLKEANGVLFDTGNELALASGEVYGAYNLSDVCDRCHEAGVRVIGRIVCFKDPGLAQLQPDRAIKDSAGNVLLFESEGGKAFLDPYNADNWDYLIELAVEAIGRGVDEIQFDYIRFPTGSTVSGNEPYYGLAGTVPEKSEAINRFIRTARVRIQDTLAVPVSCDLFGIIVTSQLDGSLIGQDFPTVGLAGEDSVCPMIYPSHYALGTMIGYTTFEKPDLYPYDLMSAVLGQGQEAWRQEGYCTVRPYVQAFTASYIGEGNYMNYGYEEINDQIRAIQDAGLDEFILWNASAVYPQGNYGGNEG